MRKSLGIFLAGIMMVGLIGCSNAGGNTEGTTAPEQTQKVTEDNAETKADNAETKADTESMFIGFSLPTQSVERWVKDGEQMQEECDKRGYQLSIQLANDDAGKQVSQCENLISQGVDLLIVAPHDGQAAATITEMAHEAKIPIISYDRLILDSEVDYYVAFDSVEVGRLQGEYLTKLVPKGNYVVLSGDATDNNAKLFKQGAMEFIQPLVDSGDITIVADQAVKGWEPANALKIMEDALTANDNDVQGVICPNDGTSGACIEALAVQGLAGKVVITGGDCDVTAVQRIIEGTQSMTVLKNTGMLVVAALDAAEAIMKGEEPAVNGVCDNGSIEVPTVYISPEVITKDNVDEKLIDTGLMKKEEVYRN